MKEFEQKLCSLRLAEPSSKLDRRIEESFSAAERKAQARVRKAAWWWLLGPAIAAGGVITVLALSPRPAPVRAGIVVYRVEAQGRLREMLLQPAASSRAPSAFSVQIEPH